MGDILLAGTGASPGQGTGPVRVIGSLDDLPLVQLGDVVVAAATSPAYTPAMAGAAALVTDRGGLLSHAAIVARELLESFGVLGGAIDALEDLERRLVARLPRFGGYTKRLRGALRASVEDPQWIAGTQVDSMHTVWFEFHEDLIATLGIQR